MNRITTEKEWLASQEPNKLVRFLGSKASSRKVRLALCACCRRFWDQLADPRLRAGVEENERFAEGQSSPEEHQQAFEQTVAALGQLTCWDPHIRTVAARAARAVEHSMMADPAVRVATLAFGVMGGERANGGISRTEQAHIVRDVLGNPFRPVTLEPAWLTRDVVGLAQAIYTENAFDRLPILADALEDGGCASEALLSHYREEADHVRGCWVVDLILGKG